MKDICISDVMEVDAHRSDFQRMCYICDTKFNETWNRHIYDFHGFISLSDVHMKQYDDMFKGCKECQKLIVEDPEAATSGVRGWIHVEQRQRVLR